MVGTYMPFKLPNRPVVHYAKRLTYAVVGTDHQMSFLTLCGKAVKTMYYVGGQPVNCKDCLVMAEHADVVLVP